MDRDTLIRVFPCPTRIVWSTMELSGLAGPERNTHTTLYNIHTYAGTKALGTLSVSDAVF